MQDRNRQLDENLLQRAAGPYIGSKGGILDAGQLLPLAPISRPFLSCAELRLTASRTAVVPQTAADFRHRHWCDLSELIVSVN
jgi:hypothetical protein